MKTAVIIGAGPAGLTAALELLQRTDIKPVVFELSDTVGGLSRTVLYKGNRIDIGGHRFFSKSERVVRQWRRMLPLQGIHSVDDASLQRITPIALDDDGPDPKATDRVMLVRKRFSRILFMDRFFDYPLSLNYTTMRNLGWGQTGRIGLSYLKSRIQQIQPERSLQDFFINRFGQELYETFFRSYTEKVWGVPCAQLSAEWGSQRVKGVSLSKTIVDAVRHFITSRETNYRGETSLARWFMYPKFGPGQFWEETAAAVRRAGGEIHLCHNVVDLRQEHGRIIGVGVRNQQTGVKTFIPADYVFSTMPVRDLVRAMGEVAPKDIQDIARGLQYRDYIIVGMLLKRLNIGGQQWNPSASDRLRDNWIYIQKQDVMAGRLQIFNNWSPYMVRDNNKVWVGMEYFCRAGDQLWNQADTRIADLAASELLKLQMVGNNDVLDQAVVRVLSAYPVSSGSYTRFLTLRNYTDSIENLFLIGRNGTHKYCNQDHSMLTAMTAIDNIVDGRKDKAKIWDANAETPPAQATKTFTTWPRRPAACSTSCAASIEPMAWTASGQPKCQRMAVPLNHEEARPQDSCRLRSYRRKLPY